VCVCVCVCVCVTTAVSVLVGPSSLLLHMRSSGVVGPCMIAIGAMVELPRGQRTRSALLY